MRSDKEQVMPTYEYSCKECGTYGSVHRTYKEDDNGMNCPRCKTAMARIFTTPGISFKGDGWAGKTK
jgi:putative FmdB family regulatory protein